MQITEDRSYTAQWAILPSNKQFEKPNFLKIRLNNQHSLWHQSKLRLLKKTINSTTAWVIGLAHNTQCPAGDPLHNLSSIDNQSVVNLLKHLCGHYILILAAPDSITIYTDPAGTMNTYYKGGSAASTPKLIPGAILDPSVAQQYSLRGSDDWYPGDSTPYHGIKALYANHKLELNSSEIERFWPQPCEQNTISRQNALTEIANLHRNIVTGFANMGKCVFSLTGGKETRVNLAAAKTIKDQLTFFTITTKQTANRDVEIAKELAKKFDLDHHIIDGGKPTEELLKLYDENCSSMSIGPRRLIIDACDQVSQLGEIHVSGVLGDYLKSQFWPSEKPTNFSSKMLLNEFVNKSVFIQDAIAGWEKTLPKELAIHTKYDLMYLEQRGGRWAGAGESACSLFYESAPAYSSRQTFELIQSMPRTLERHGTIHKDLVEILWPELLTIPYKEVTRNIGVFIPKNLKQVIKKMFKIGI